MIQLSDQKKHGLTKSSQHLGEIYLFFLQPTFLARLVLSFRIYSWFPLQNYQKLVKSMHLLV